VSFFVCVILGVEPGAFTLSHSTNLIFVKGFSRQVLTNFLLGLAFNYDPLISAS
jgi:hypothetical protein